MVEVGLSKEEMIRAEIIEAAQKLFQHYGLAKTTMEDIAKAMGRGKSTLYYYYKSKDEIFEAVVLKESKEVLNAVLEAISHAPSANEKLQLFFKTTFEEIKSKINLYSILREEILNDEASPCGTLKRAAVKQISIMDYNEKERQVVKDILLGGINNGEFIDDIKESIDVVSYIIITALRSIFIDVAFTREIPTFFDKEKANVMIKILLRGLKK